MPATFLLIRHCAAQGQEPDAPLTALGREQAQRLAQTLAAERVDRIVSSPYLRALQSIQPLASARALNIVPELRLIERALSGDSRPDWRQRLRESFDDIDVRLPGGETSREAMSRGREVIDELVPSGGCSVVVTHGNLLTLLLRSFNAAHGFATWEGLRNPDIYRVTRLEHDTHIERVPLH